MITVLACLITALVVGVVNGRINVRLQKRKYEKGKKAGLQAGYQYGWEDGIEGARDAMPDLRPEIMVEDWGPEHGEMRFRWAVWEADRAIDCLAEPDMEPDEPGTIGTLTPYMLGNAPTKAMAQAQALAWIEASSLFSDDRVVVRV